MQAGVCIFDNWPEIMEQANFEDSFMDCNMVAENIGAIDRGGVNARAGVVTALDVVVNVRESHRFVGHGITVHQSCRKG